MGLVSKIVLKDLSLPTNIGSYGPNDVVPKEHVLDMNLLIAQDLVLIENDDMEFGFDYDPLIATIEGLARERHYHTQEYLLTRIVQACAKYTEIEGVSLNLRKMPVLSDGSLGVEISVDKEYLKMVRIRP